MRRARSDDGIVLPGVAAHSMIIEIQCCPLWGSSFASRAGLPLCGSVHLTRCLRTLRARLQLSSSGGRARRALVRATAVGQTESGKYCRGFTRPDPRAAQSLLGCAAPLYV